MAIIKCPECGHDVSDQAPFCPQCGVRIAGNVTTTPPPVPNAAPTTTPTPQANNEEPKKSNKTTIIISIIIALVVCGTMYYFYSDAQSSKEKEAYEYAKQTGKKLHLMGLTSNGGVHSSLDHLFKLIEVGKEYGLSQQLFVHLSLIHI